MADGGNSIEYLKLNYSTSCIRDSDTEYQTESDSDTDTSDSDVSDVDISNINFNGFQDANCLTYYQSLTSSQKKAYRVICNLFTKKNNQVVTINAPSGTGKTFLLTTLAETYSNCVQYLTFRRDQASGIRLQLNDFRESYTYISFYVNCLHLNYFRAIGLFHMTEKEDTELLYKLILNANKYLNTGIKIIIVDSCTVPSPSMLLMLYIISLKHQMHLIFAGNKLQLSAIHKSSAHSRGNFDIIKQLSTVTIKKLSDKNSFDKVLTNKISEFRRTIQRCRRKNGVPFQFNLRYYLYCSFRAKYFTEERFDVMYMAQFHQNITNRVKRFIKHLNESGVKYFISPFCVKNQTAMEPICTEEEGKFYPGLVLVEGYKYIHIDQNGIHSAVLLEKIISTDCINISSLEVRYLESNQKVTLQRIGLNYYQILPALRSWLLDKRNSDVKLYQFPLRPYTLTYHAALGKTITEEKVELSADCSFANAIYVGLCCIRNYNEISKIHAERDLPSFVLTDYMRKEEGDMKYYYRCPSTISDPDKAEIMRYVYTGGRNAFIDEINWVTVADIPNFERKNLDKYTRIVCSSYDNPIKKTAEEGDTRLMKIVDFVKNNPYVILNTLANAPVGDLHKYNNKKTQSAELKNSKVYVSLKEEYTNWCIAEE